MADTAGLDGQLGPKIDTASAQYPGQDLIIGTLVTLKRLSPSHIQSLFSCIGNADQKILWTYLPTGPFDNYDAFALHVERCIADPSKAFYTIIDNNTSEAAGLFALLSISTENRDTEIGYIVFGPALQRTRAATEAVYLLSRHTFETLGYRRYVWKCDALNGPSKRAAERYGFVYEGTFRQHLIVKGRNRDTSWYSILDSEWGNVKKSFESWLKDENFNAEGRQIRSLLEMRGAA